MSGPIIILRGKTVDLGLVQKNYLFTICSIVNDARVAKFITTQPPASMESEEEWLEHINKSKTQKVFAILKKKGSKRTCIGITDITIRPETNGVGGTGTVMKFDELGKGYGTEAKHLALFYAFYFLGLKKIRTSVFSMNLRSKRFMEKTGHQCVAVFKDEFIREGKPCDHLIMEVTKESWQPTWDAYKKTHGMDDPF